MSTHFRFFTGILLALLAAVTPALAATAPALRIVTLNTVLTEIAREVAGENATVTGLVQPGVDPHEYEPSPADIKSLVEADLVLASGLHLEGYLERLVSGAGARGRIVYVGDAVPVVLTLPVAPAPAGPNPPAARSGSGDELDPHWWHSIGNVLFATDLVRGECTRLRPALAASYARNAQAYEERLFTLQSWAAREIATLPPARRQLVTSHDAFGYFARDFGFTIHSINGYSTDGEPDARHVAELIDLIRREKIKAVFAESTVNPKLVGSLLGAGGVRLGGTLYADGLSAADGDGANYVAMYRHNVRTIIGALR